MNFKVGDKVKGLSDTYLFTNTDMYLGEVKDVGDHSIEIVVLKHKNSNEIGNFYVALNPEGKFEIVKNKNGKFFKSLPNNFTGTLEVENGFIVEKEILDDVEKEYLSAVIRPFKNEVKSIKKSSGAIHGEFIHIYINGDCPIEFPTFKKGTMYKGMELEKQYTLKELGLDE
jgi:hypothetical protein